PSRGMRSRVSSSPPVRMVVRPAGGSVSAGDTTEGPGRSRRAGARPPKRTRPATGVAGLAGPGRPGGSERGRAELERLRRQRRGGRQDRARPLEVVPVDRVVTGPDLPRHVFQRRRGRGDRRRHGRRRDDGRAAGARGRGGGHAPAALVAFAAAQLTLALRQEPTAAALGGAAGVARRLGLDLAADRLLVTARLRRAALVTTLVALVATEQLAANLREQAALVPGVAVAADGGLAAVVATVGDHRRRDDHSGCRHRHGIRAGETRRQHQNGSVHLVDLRYGIGGRGGAIAVRPGPIGPPVITSRPPWWVAAVALPRAEDAQP